MNKILVEQNGSIFNFEFDGSNDVKEMSYTEIQEYDDLEDFLNQVVDSVSNVTESKEDVVITLTDETGVFIWSIIIAFDAEELNYKFVDWEGSGKTIKYDK